MKFFTTTATVLLASATHAVAKPSSLRANTKPEMIRPLQGRVELTKSSSSGANTEPDMIRPLQARVNVGGLLNDFSNGDLQVLDQAVIKAYNAAYDGIGYHLKDSQSEASIFVADAGTDEGNTGMANTNVLHCWGWDCFFCAHDDDDDWCGPQNANCYRDDDMSILSQEDASALMIGKVHQTFQDGLCEELRSSGVVNFALAKECSVVFFEEPSSGTTLLQSTDNIYELRDTQATQVQLTLGGMFRDPSTMEIQLLSEVVMEAHSDAFAGSGYDLAGFEVVSTVHAVAGEADGEWNTVLFATGIPMVDNNAAGIEDVTLFHMAFEATVCSRLAKSGHATFASVSDCHFQYINNPILDAEVVQKKLDVHLGVAQA